MFVGTHLGMFMPALRPDHASLPDGEPELQVRARRRVDLDRLRKFMRNHGLELGPTVVLPQQTDYQFRAYCTRAAWGQALARFAEEIDYTKFKDTPAKKHRDHALTSAYGKMWSALLNAFPAGSVYGDRRTARKTSGRKGQAAQASLFSDRKNWWEDV
jgi:hypothetical protein